MRKWQRSPQLLEEEVVAPIVKALLGAPGVKAIRGTAHMGYAFIFVVLDDGVQREPARQRVLDRGSMRFVRNCRLMPPSAWDRMPAAWDGSISTRWSTGSRRAICVNCAC